MIAPRRPKNKGGCQSAHELRREERALKNEHSVKLLHVILDSTWRGCNTSGRSFLRAEEPSDTSGSDEKLPRNTVTKESARSPWRQPV
jgi:hypothetical protein